MRSTTDEQRARLRAKLTPPDVPAGFRHLWTRTGQLLTGAEVRDSGIAIDWVGMQACARMLNWNSTAWESETVLLMAKEWKRAATPKTKSAKAEGE